jgi:hypothetical protein
MLKTIKRTKKGAVGSFTLLYTVRHQGDGRGYSGKYAIIYFDDKKKAHVAITGSTSSNQGDEPSPKQIQAVLDQGIEQFSFETKYDD